MIKKILFANALGIWLSTFGFAFQQEPITTFPYLETFDSNGGALPADWTITEEDSWSWIINSGVTIFPGTGPNTDHTTFESTGDGFFMHTAILSSVTSGSIARLKTPEIDLSGIAAPTLLFHYHMFGSNIGTLQVNVLSEGETVTTTLLEITGQQHASGDEPYSQAEVFLEAFRDQVISLEFAGSAVGGFNNQIAIDDVRLEESTRDLALIDIPFPGTDVFGEDVVVIEIQNQSLEALEVETFQVSYFVDETLAATETLTASLIPEEVLSYTFQTTFDFSNSGSQRIRAEVELAGDREATNDAFEKVVVNTPFIGNYTMTQNAPGVGVFGLPIFGTETLEVFLQKSDEDHRTFSATYLGGESTDFTFIILPNFIDGTAEAFFQEQEVAEVVCEASGLPVVLQPADLPGILDLNDDDTFTMTLEENANDCGIADATFTLVKDAIGPDLVVEEVLGPLNGELNAASPVSFIMRNVGPIGVAAPAVSIVLDGVEVIRETVGQPVAAGQSIAYTTTATLDLSAPQSFDLEVVLEAARDINLENNALAVRLDNFERQALEALYHAWSGDEWTDNTHWLSDAPLGSWFGVEVNGDNRVTELNLTANNLVGAIPNEIGDLSHLTFLGLDFNALAGNLPASIWDLTLLTVLSMEGNSLDGHILPDIGSLNNLEYFNVSDNDFSGSIPEELGALAELEVLFLNDNDFSGEIPAAFGDLSKLVVADLDRNQLTGEIPSALGNLSNLKELDLNQNQLVGSIPTELGNLGALEFLDLGANGLSGLIPLSLADLGNLKVLLLAGNNLSGGIPPELGSLVDLERLELSNNQLIGNIPSELGNLGRLDQLNFDNNQLSGPIPSELGALSNLVDLELQSNSLEGAVPQELTDLINLRRLNLSRNHLTSLPTFDNGTLGGLEFFEAQENAFGFDALLPNISVLTEYTPQANVDEEETLTPNEVTSITLEVTERTALNEYQWLKDGTAIAGANDPSFTIAELSVSDEGEYTCRISNPGAPLLTLTRNTIFLEVNEAPTSVILDNTTIAENQPTGTLVANLTATDPDEDETFTFSLSGTDAASFQVEGNELQSAEAFNFESQSVYSVTVTATDFGGLAVSEDFTITVIDENESPTAVNLDKTMIAENQSAGTVVGTLTAPDPDDGDTFTFSLAGDDAASFQLADAELQSAEAFDFEVQSNYSVTVTVADEGGLTISDDFTINVIDENESPTAVTLDNTTIAENRSAGTVVGTLSVSDPDGGDTFTFSLSGDDATSFQLDGAEFQSTEVFDFEVQSSYSVTVTVTDEGGLAISDDLTITVIDESESPIALALDNATIVENRSKGSLVGNLTAIDPDAGDTFNFTLSGDDAASFQVAGAELQSADVFDFEVQSSYLVTITATDEGGLTISDDFTITVIDENESPAAVTMDNAAIAENPSAGTVVGTLSVSDPDVGDTFTFSLSGDDASSFQVDGAELQSAEVFDFEAQPSYSVTITATDEGGLTISDDFTITVIDENESPVAVALDNTTILENRSTGTLVGKLTATDPDVGDTFTFSLSGDDASSFQVAGAKLQTAEVLDFEIQSSYTITVTTTDGGGLTAIADFNVTVIDENEAPTDILLDGNEVLENLPVGTVIGDLTATDPDAGDTFSFTIADDTPTFQIVGSELQTARVLDFDIESEFEVLIEVSDAEGLTLQKAFLIVVLDEVALSATMLETQAIRIYPNPSSGRFNLEWPSTLKVFEWLITDLSGNALMGSTDVGLPRALFEVDVSALANGIYALQLRTNEGTFTKRLVLSR